MWKFKLGKLNVIVAVLVMLISFQTKTVAFADSYTWTSMTSETGGQYWSAVISDSGSLIITSDRSAYIRRSTNAGASWTTFTGLASGSYYFAMSKDGTKILAVANEGSTSYRSQDSGATWTVTNIGGLGSRRPCMSDDGTKMMVPRVNAVPRISSDSGATWSDSTLTNLAWMSCAMSADGTKIFMVAQGTYNFYASSNSGASWSTTTLVDAYPNDVATSADGGIVYIANNSTRAIYRSINSGVSFVKANPSTTMASPNFVSTSDDGQTVVVFDGGSTIKTSIDGGNTWVSETGAGTHNWYAGDITSDGSKIVAPDATNGSYVWKSTFVVPSSLTLTSGSAISLNYRTINTITATSNYAGKVTFFANGKRIGNCVAVPTVSLVATCNYKPTIHGAVRITANFVPTNSSYTSISTELFRTKISGRPNNR